MEEIKDVIKKKKEVNCSMMFFLLGRTENKYFLYSTEFRLKSFFKM